MPLGRLWESSDWRGARGTSPGLSMVGQLPTAPSWPLYFP